MLTDACLDENAIVAFLAGRTAAADRPALEHHLQACGACADLVTWVAADLAHRSRSPGAEGRPFIGTLAAGARVDRYQILGTVGRGGMGEVYAAYHPDLDRRVALKVVHESNADNAERRARLLHEARVIARLSHPNVVTVYDAGTFDDRVFIAMEFVAGHTVDAWLRAEQRSWREVLDVFIAAGRGLAAAHAAGVVHRDFKPQNVMIDDDGIVRVMDFGLARLAEEPAEDAAGTSDLASRPRPPTVTKTGVQVGTPAYMAPEQFRGEPLDARADQFSFCVAMHEALYGIRPALAHASPPIEDAATGRPRPAVVPAWLKTVVSRGLAQDRERRFASLGDLLRALTRGRDAPRRRTIATGGVLGLVLLALGGWRATAREIRISCAVPTTRLEAAWSGHDEGRRQSMHRAFTGTGLPNAEMSWQRVAQVLDDYVAKWSAMYLDTCEATHVRGEQSGEVLDLRMSCLNENLAEVRALTDVLLSANATAVSRAASAAGGLSPPSRCADVAVLRSAVPLPRDPNVLHAVQQLKAELMHLRALADLGDRKRAASMAEALQPKVEDVGYRPLLAELLELVAIGKAEQRDAAQAETVAERSFLIAEASGDDVTAVRAASLLIYVVGYQLHRREDAARWARQAYALLDKLGPTQSRLRAWILVNDAAVAAQAGDYEGARTLVEESVRLKVQALGERHWDVGLSLFNLAGVLNLVGEPREALAAADRAVAILDVAGTPEDGSQFADLLTNRATALTALGRYDEAERDFARAFQIRPRDNGPPGMQLGDQLHGYGTLRVAQGRAAEAIAMLEEALKIREQTNSDATFTADTRFSLARALWDAKKHRPRARALAASASAVYAKHRRTREETAVATWLAARPRAVTHGRAHPRC